MFWVRTLSGIVLVALSFLFIHFGGIPLIAALGALSAGAFYEMSKALGLFEKKKVNAIAVTGFLFVVLYYVALGFTNPVNTGKLLMVVVFGIIIFLGVYVCAFPKYSAEDIMSGIFAFVYGPLMLSYVYLTRSLENGKYSVWLIFICAWGYDTCAYCVGSLFGKTIGNHKVFPKLSPKKSMEGIIGGVIGAAILAFVYSSFFFEESRWKIAIVAVFAALVAQLGDLAASAVKRNKEIKDYSHLIPGHGGILDRFDSMIFTAPVIFYLLTMCNIF